MMPTVQYCFLPALDSRLSTLLRCAEETVAAAPFFHDWNSYLGGTAWAPTDVGTAIVIDVRANVDVATFHVHADERPRLSGWWLLLGQYHIFQSPRAASRGKQLRPPSD